jgi:hypothetical protein
MATPRQDYGAPVFQTTCGGLSEQFWAFGYVDPRYGGTYDSLRNAYNELCARSEPGGLNVALYECAGSPYVKRFVYGTSGWFQIYNRDAGTCLAVNSYADRARVFEWWCIDGNNAEVWRAGDPSNY